MANYDGGTTPTLLHVHLTRPASSDAPADAAAWGFRLLSTNNGIGVQQVQRGTLADICGLLAGDDILRINSRDTSRMSLEEARAVIAQAGNDVELVVQRGPTRVWQPTVYANTGNQHVLTGAHDTQRSRSRQGFRNPTGATLGGHPGGHHYQPHYNSSQQLPPAYANGPVNWSLAMPPRHEVRLVTMFNSPPKPFYLSNVGAATLDRRQHRQHRHHHHSQAMHQSTYANFDDELQYENAGLGHQDEVRSTSTGGSRGRHQRAPYAPSNNNDYEDEVAPRGRQPKSGSWLKNGVPVLPTTFSAPPPPPPPPPPPMPSHHNHRSLSSGRSPRGPAINAGVGLLIGGTLDSANDPPRCMACTGFVTGVFAKIRGQPIHPECFRCTTCGTSLKNRGHFWTNDRLYCEVHARQNDTRSNVLY